MARLPIYHRALVAFAERDVTLVQSSDLALETGIHPATVRRDLTFLGSLGVRGSGYEVSSLLAALRKVLGAGLEWNVVIAGAGNLGKALACSSGFNAGGFRVVGLVDVDRAVIGTEVGPHVVRHLDQLEALVAIGARPRTIGVIATPGGAAQDVAERMVLAGVGALLSFAPAVVVPPSGVQLRRVDLSAELEVLAFYRAQPAALEGS